MNFQPVSTANSCTSPRVVPARRLENIRASCDNCARSKVRCSKEQPECQRCIHQGVSCTYSPSQRARRRIPRGSTTAPFRQQLLSPGRSTLTRNTAVDQSDSNHNHHHNNHGDKARERVLDFDFDRAPSEPGNHNPSSLPSLFPADVDSPSKWGGMITPLDEPTHSQWQFDQCGSFDDLDRQFPRLFHHDGTKTPRSPSSQERFDDEGATSYSQLRYQCSDVATSIIQTLDIPMASCSSLANPDAAAVGTATSVISSQSGHGHRPGSRSFETILKNNRAALDNVLTILQCSCTAKADLVFLVMTVCSRVLSWYQASLHRSASGKCRSNNSSCSFRSCSTATPSYCSASATTTSTAAPETSLSPFIEWVSIPSIRIGGYTLEHEHSDRMVGQLILTELVKVKEVVDAFALTYCHRGDGASKCSSQAITNEDGEDKLHLALEAFLRSRLRAAVRTAREQLN